MLEQSELIKKRRESKLYTDERIDLTFKCNNNCIFCYDGEKRKNIENMSLQNAINKVIEAKNRGINEVRLRGSEPTIYPYLLELTEFIKNQGLKFNLASNARMFYYKEFTKRMAENGLTWVYTSLHGHTSELHGSITRSQESFKQTTIGIKNLLEAGIKVETNTTIVKQNIKYLKDIAKFLNENFKLSRMRFAFLWCKANVIENLDVIPALTETRPFLLEAMNYLKENGPYVFIEKAPICLLPEFEQDFKSEPYMLEENTKPEICSSCKYYKDNYCVGISPVYLKLYGEEGIKPLK